MKKSLALLIIFAVIFVSGCGAKKEEKKESVVKTAMVTKAKRSMDFVDNSFTGAVTATTQTKLSFKVGGNIKKIYVSLGEKVKKGQLIAEIDSKDYNLQYQTANAGLKTATLSIQEAKTRMDQASAAYEQSKSQVEQAKTGVENAKVQYDTITKKFDRISQMYEDGSASLNDYEAAKLAKDSSKLGLNSAKTQLEQANTGVKNALVVIEQAKVGLSLAESQVNSVSKNVELAQNQLNYSKLYSPEDGYVVMKTAEENENIGANTPILTLNTGKNFEVNIYVPEAVISKLKIGQEADIKIEAVGNEEIRGVIKEIGNASTGFGTTYPVVLSLKVNDEKIKSGMTASVNIKVDNRIVVDSIAIPVKSVQKDSKGNYVFTATAVNGKYVLNKKYVTTGSVSNDGIQISKGLSEGEFVLTAGIRFAVEGEYVNIKEEKKE